MSAETCGVNSREWSAERVALLPQCAESRSKLVLWHLIVEWDVTPLNDPWRAILEFDEDRYRDEGYRSELGGYYGQGGAGYRDDLL
jgi:hypothetical protein